MFLNRLSSDISIGWYHTELLLLRRRKISTDLVHAMTQEENIPEELDARSMAEALKMLQEGEETAGMMEAKLDRIEATLEKLLAQMEGAQNGEETAAAEPQDTPSQTSPDSK